MAMLSGKSGGDTVSTRVRVPLACAPDDDDIKISALVNIGSNRSPLVLPMVRSGLPGAGHDRTGATARQCASRRVNSREFNHSRLVASSAMGDLNSRANRKLVPSRAFA